MQNQFHLFWKIVFLIIVVTLNAACAKQVIIPHDPSTPKILFTISNAISEAHIIRAAAQIDLITPGGYYPARAALILKKPSYLRLELLPPMGPPEFFLATTPQKMRILLPTKGEFYQGEPTGYNLSRFLPWQFNIEDIVAIFANTYPPLAGDVTYLRYPEESTLRIEMKVRSGIAQTIWIGPTGRLSKLVRFDENGKLLYSAEFADYEEGSSIAGKITVNMADGVTSIIIKYSDLKIEKTQDLSIFDLPVPEGFKKIIMD
ncbi:MAG: hypothetical protein AB2L12_03955 [Smithellaceae bacterium]